MQNEDQKLNMHGLFSNRQVYTTNIKKSKLTDNKGAIKKEDKENFIHELNVLLSIKRLK
jgi:hypothetical protein